MKTKELSKPGAASNSRRLAWLLDESIRLPGGLRIGIDGILGLIPGIGDVIGMALSSVIVADAARQGVPSAILARMVVNVLIETAVGAIPVLGDLFDFFWKANSRNLRLMDAATQDSRRVRRRSLGWLLLLLGGVVIAAAVLVWMLVEVLAWAVGGLGIGSL